MFKISDEQASPNDGVGLRYLMKWNRQMRGVFEIYVEPESTNEGAV